MREPDLALLALETDVKRITSSIESIDPLLQTIDDHSKSKVINPEEMIEIKKMQRLFLLDSFKVNKFHKDYKSWENKEVNTFIDTEAYQYNKRLGKMARLNDDIEISEKEYDKLRNTIKLPSFLFSLQTIEAFQDGKLLKYLEKNESGQYPSKVDLNDLFSLNPNSNLMTLKYDVFNQLINIEYRLRMQRQIIYEILFEVKQQLTLKNQKWASRDSILNQFMSKDLPHMFEAVSKIKQNESEDLRDFDNDDEDVAESDNEEEQGLGTANGDSDEEIQEDKDNDENNYSEDEHRPEPYDSNKSDEKTAKDQGQISPHKNSEETLSEVINEPPMGEYNEDDDDDVMNVDS